MTFLSNPKNYTPATFKAFVKTLPLNGWKPKFITLHNTASPTLAQWWNETEMQRHQRIVNLNAMYKNADHWHSGPHLFIDQYEDGIWNACDLTQDGVSVSCFNHITMGIEMVGNYALPDELGPHDPPADNWASDMAHVVRDNAVTAMAILHNHFGLRPDGFVEGVKGLHFHRDCKNDHHLCPGGQVNRADIVARVLAKMKDMEAVIPTS